MSLQQGIAFYRAGDLTAARQALENAVHADPTQADAYLVLAHIARAKGDLPTAATHLAAARRLKPNSGEVEGFHFSVCQTVCDWDDFDDRLAALGRAIAANDGTLDPSIALTVPGIEGRALRQITTAFAARLPRTIEPADFTPRATDAPIALAYISPDFQETHPVGRHMLEVFRRHDRARFTVRGYSLMPPSPKDAVFAEALGSFTSLADLSDGDATARIRADGIELLVDLGGYTRSGRPGILANRAAPVQINYLGHSGTSGGLADYILTDRVVSPPDKAPHFTEALAYLPTFLNGAWQRPPAIASTRSAWNLPEKAFVLCAFCANHKIMPDLFDAWMTLLRELPTSVLWLREYSPYVVANIRKEAQKRNVSANRIVFAAPAKYGRHFGRMACADLFLDTAPYNGGSTAADTLWAGLPVVTCVGDTFVSRMAASINQAVGLQELVTNDLESYVGKVIELAYDPDHLRHIRSVLATAREESAFFAADPFTTALEALYGRMAERHRAGQSATFLDEA